MDYFNMEFKNVYIVGFGGNSKVVMDICIRMGIEVLGFFDDNYQELKNKNYRGVKVIGPCKKLLNHCHSCKNVVVTIGNIKIRDKVCRMYMNAGFDFPNIISPDSYIAPTVKMGYGNVIYNCAHINSDGQIGNFNLINSFANIEHDCIVGDLNNISPKCNICGNCKIGNRNFIGASTTCRNKISIGDNNIIGCGTNIVKSVINNERGFGNPFTSKY